MKNWLPLFGILVFLGSARGVFHTLFHPPQQGGLNEWIAQAIWRGTKRILPRALNYAGPVAFVSVVLYWTVSMIMGFALIYRPQISHIMAFTSGLDRTDYQSFVGALNASIGSLITLST